MIRTAEAGVNRLASGNAVDFPVPAVIRANWASKYPKVRRGPTIRLAEMPFDTQRKLNSHTAQSCSDKRRRSCKIAP